MGQVIVNKPAQAVADIIHFTDYNIAVSLIEAAAIAYFPPLGGVGINTVFHAVLTFFAGKLYYPLAAVGINITITLQTDAQKSAKREAEGKLRAANMTGDPAIIKKATDDYKEAARKLMHYDGDAKP